MKQSLQQSLIRIMLVDDHSIVLAGLRFALSSYEDIEVVGIAGEAQTAIEFATELQPDVALLDIGLPGGDGFEIAKLFQEASPHTRIIFLSGSCTSASIEQALELGAAGFLLKTEPPEVIAESIRRTLHGKISFSKEIRDLVEPDDNGYRLSFRKGARIVILSPREREMLKALSGGYVLKQVARRMGISYKSADHLKASVMKKLDIHDRVALTRFAISQGVIDAESEI